MSTIPPASASKLPLAVAPEIIEATEALTAGAKVTCERIDSMLNVVESRYDSLKAKAERLKELIQANADKFAEETKEFLASMQKLDMTLENESKRVNGEPSVSFPRQGT